MIQEGYRPSKEATTVASNFLSWRESRIQQSLHLMFTGTPPSHLIVPRRAKSVAKHEKDARFPARHHGMIGIVWRHHKIGIIV